MLKIKDHPNNTPENAKKYVLSRFENTYYLGYRDVPCLIKKHVLGSKALDYGCGTGRSTRFLKTLGLDSIGVDISKEMLEQALVLDDPSHYLLIEHAKIPVLDCSYDFIFSCFVFLTISSKEEILSALHEIYRCLKKGGIFIMVTGSERLYSHEWLSYHVNYPENQTLTSGIQTKIKLKDLGLEFVNYYWTDADYCNLFKSAKLELLEKHFPLGSQEENPNWISETTHAPYTIYVLKKPL